MNGLSTDIFIRTSTEPTAYYANGNVNVAAFAAIGGGDGYVPYEAGTKTFRYMQIKFVVNNTLPDDYDFTLDKFRYTIEKEQVIFSNTTAYASNPTTIDYGAAGFLNRPVINYTILDQKDAASNPSIAVTTAASNQNVSFILVSSNGTGPYLANSSANVMITAIGV